MKTHTHVFGNGFRLVYEQSAIPITHIQTFCLLGSAYETDGIRGASHFIEHMCFKGTTHLTEAGQVNRESDKIGAYMNAFTEKEYTCYVVKCDSNYAKHMLHLSSDILLNSVFEKSECEKEEQVVIEENVRFEDDMMDKCLIGLQRLMFSGSALENPIDELAYHKTKRLECSVVHKIYNQFYHPSRMVLSVVSNLSFAAIRRFVESSYFVKTRRPLASIDPPNLCISSQTQPNIRLLPDKTKTTTHIMIGFRFENADRHTMVLLQKIVGGPTSSRLFSLLREKNGLTYTSTVSVELYTTMGAIIVYAETDTRRLIHDTGGKKGVLPTLFAILQDIVKNGVDASEMSLAKQYINGFINTGLDNGGYNCKSNGLAALMYPVEPICPVALTYDRFYKDVTRAQVNAAAKKYFTENNMNICIAGGDLPNEATIRRHSKLI